MSLLESIADSRAFSERPLEIYEIGDLYVPFREITGENPESLAESLQKT